MSSWTIPLVTVALMIFLVGPALGLYFWNPERTRAVRHIENFDEQQAVIAHIAYIRLRHPEIVKGERLDRHPAYLWGNLTMFAYGCVVAFVEVPYSNLGSETLGTRETLAGSLLLGSGAALIGSLMGKSFGGSAFASWVVDHDSAAMLGDDIRVPYVLAWCGLASTAISMGFYGYTVIATAGVPRLLTTLGGIAAVGFASMCMTLIPLFVSRIRNFVSARDVVRAEAYAIMAEQDSKE